MSVHSGNQAQRFADSGFGILLHSLVQSLLSLRHRPENPVEWLLRKLKAGEYALDERTYETFLRHAVETAALRPQRSTSRVPTITGQLVVVLAVDLSRHYHALHDGAIMADDTLMRLASLIADYAMWEEISQPTFRVQAPCASPSRPVCIRSQMLLSDYVSCAGAALRLVAGLRDLASPQRSCGFDVTVFDAIFDLTEVLLKMRCFAAQSDIDATGDHAAVFTQPSTSAAAADQLPQESTPPPPNALSLAASSLRSFRVIFIQPYVRSLDGVMPCAKETAEAPILRAFRLASTLARCGGFPNTQLQCIATDIPDAYTTQAQLHSQQVRTELAVTPDELLSCLQPIEFLDAYVRSGKHPDISCKSVSVVRSSACCFNDAADRDEDDLDGSLRCNEPLQRCCPSRLCHSLHTYCTAAAGGGGTEHAAPDVAPPCVMVLPVFGSLSAMAAPLVVTVGMSLCAHVARFLQHATPTFVPEPAAPAVAAVPQTGGEDKNKKKGGKDKAPAAAAAASSQGSDAAASPSTFDGSPEATSASSPTGPTTSQARRAAFGDAYALLFNGNETSSESPTPCEPLQSFLVVLLKPLSSALRTKAQSAAATLLMMSLIECLGVPPALRPAQHYTLPLIGAIAFSWSPAITQHSAKSCWWRLAAGSHAASPAVGGASEPQAVTFDAPLAKACVSLTALIDQSPSVNHATSLVKLYDRVVSAGGLESQAAAACIMQSLLSCCDFAASSANRESPAASSPSPAASPAHSSKTNKAAPSPQGAEAAGDSKTAARDQRTASDMAVIIKARQLLCTRGNAAQGALQVADFFANMSLENPTLLEVSQWILKHLV